MTIYERNMAYSETIFAPSRATLEIAVLILPRASILEVASILDPMRNANRQTRREAFRWRVVTPDGHAAPLTCGIELTASGSLGEVSGADLLVIVSGFDQAEVATRDLISTLRRRADRFGAVAGIDAGPWIMARAELLDGHRATVHWEDLEDFAAAFPAVEVVPDRYVRSGRRLTAGGAGPAADMMLHLIGARCGLGVAGQVANSFLYDRHADAGRPQRPGRVPGARDRRLSAALTMMGESLDAPQPIHEIAAALGIGTRRLEQIFRDGLGMGPAACYLDLRLQAARRIMSDTDHPLLEIALRTGFSDRSDFSRAYRRRFGHSPREGRAAVR